MNFHPKIRSLEEFPQVIDHLKKSGKRIVFTNGCFDLLHAGHVRYLQAARALGDVLVVGVNTDASVRRIKGDSRPLVPQEERAEVLAALECVDFVILFDDPTPYRLISAVRPHVLVKGGDWAVEEIVGRDIVEADGGKVLTIPLAEGLSTSALIRRIIDRYRE
ncbi:MAG: D-glycero-beta-D-manno-heptose 1-phosphate adenylyltransferase [Nitrospirae bacterium]|nr:D-glycero-beta-D-manno-heptose 1-phosphate adenylyltransferase [Nitrospirota bacterium]